MIYLQLKKPTCISLNNQSYVPFKPEFHSNADLKKNNYVPYPSNNKKSNHNLLAFIFFILFLSTISINFLTSINMIIVYL